MKLSTIIRLIFFLFGCVFLSNLTTAATPRYYGKHIMVVVDQTKDAIGAEDIPNLYQGIVKLLKGEDPMTASLDKNRSDLPSNFSFNPESDEISLYAFGLPGVRDSKGTWNRIHGNACANPAYTEESFFNDITRGLIHPRTRFSQSGKDLNTFLAQDMKALFSGNDKIANEIAATSGITMSHYIYPCILEFINEDSKASEYYVIVVTNYQGGGGTAETGDENRIRELAGTHPTFAGSFFNRLKDLRSPFYTVNWLQMRSAIAPSNFVNGMQLGVKSLQGVSVFVVSAAELSQAQLHRDVFSLEPVEISFTKNETILIDSIRLNVTKAGKPVTSKLLATGSENTEKWFNSTTKRFVIPSQDLTLGEAASGGDNLDMEYEFYATIKSDTGNPVPYVFTAQTSIDPSNIIFVNDSRNMLIAILCIIVIIAVLVFLGVWRGRGQIVKEKVHNFSTRFSETTRENGVLELPCWFVAENQYMTGIKVEGTVTYRHPRFHIPREVSLAVMVDVDDVPEGVTVSINNDPVNAQGDSSTYYPIKLADGSFSFILNFHLDPNRKDLLDTKRVKVRLRYRTVAKLLFISSTEYHPKEVNETEDIDFYIHPEIGIAWVGIDPGTTGSCVALGRGGSIVDPNIKIVEQNGERIIPSRLAFNKSSFTDPSNAIPGEDYEYGFSANKKWTAFAKQGAPCFQSIKKLLGYQSGKGNKIVFKPLGGNQVELSGMELAHLLVEGLMKETDNYFDTLSTKEQQSLTPNGSRMRRAVVAIPNNYTLPKTLDMVKSVAETGRFDEIRPIYEAEAVLCNYLSRTAGAISNGKEVVAVYDMGGATINLTVFEITYSQKGGSIYYNVKTLGRIGYAVGGDNIDYALMKYLFSLTGLSAEAAKKRQQEKKTEILEEMLKLKKILIKYASDISGNMEMLSSSENFKEFVMNVTGINDSDQKFANFINKVSGGEAEEAATSSVNFTREIANRLILGSGKTLNSDMKRYVRNRVEEVTKEILSYPDIDGLSSVDRIIFSGRSVLFPKIKEWVLGEFKKNFPKIQEWKGLSDTDVKTAVAYGACWYGIFNGLVTLDNSRVASAYGFKITEHGKPRFVELIPQNEPFNGNESIHRMAETESDFASDGNVVEFFQIMGSPENPNLFGEENRYKVNKIGDIAISVATEKISMEVKRTNQVSYSVTLNSKEEKGRTDMDVMDRDITDENDEAYIFATYNNQKN